ncbi:MAG: glycoside hydrolase family 95-like protein [Chryseosolibacter sp.]
MINVKNGSAFWLLLTMAFFPSSVRSQPEAYHNLQFNALANSWDEGIPLGNGMLGALIWQKGENLRISLDRADLWDLRPLRGLHRPEFRYQWIKNQVDKNDYRIVQEYFDQPYEKEPAPSKIPGGALEVNIGAWGSVESVRLSLREAISEVKWKNGILLRVFVHATEPEGWFRFENLNQDFTPDLVSPKYEGKVTSSGGSVEGDDLARLGYPQGTISREPDRIVYRQEGWGGFHYEITVQWKKVNPETIEGVWSISTHYPGKPAQRNATAMVEAARSRGHDADLKSHLSWWRKFWDQSSVRVPDPALEKQWHLEQYKFGSAARQGAPPISLQAVWTADNGRIPPWKGDFHHDLNTQLSYWPAYSGNHLEEGLGYFDHLEENKANYKRFTKLFFETGGLAVPGVTTLDGTEMGGWTQYSLSPTVSAWLAHHYYLQWRYSMDRHFLENRAYPWMRETAEFLQNITTKDEHGFRKLPIGSSPEIHNNDIKAWFKETTNYDLALMRFTFNAASEMANALGLKKEADHWSTLLKEFPDYAVSSQHELMFSPSLPYNESHRHFSHLMAIHPLSLIQWEDGERSQRIIKNSLALLDKIGPDWWCGYSYSWQANLKARAKDGEGAARALGIFATAFCLKNGFHVNGDQTKSGYSKFTYRPFTLEGNFAFAAGLQEMLLQSYAGFIEIMPAVPVSWKNVSFSQLRAEGAFLISATKVDGILTEVKIKSEQGGKARIKAPFKNFTTAQGARKKIKKSPGFWEIDFEKGEEIILHNAD